ncbi:MAG: CocE/NonD family hydrolase, partial [Acidimicrobiales bacterium]
MPLSDGVNLAGRIWLPGDAADNPVPAILDFLPYRYGDLMAARDWSQYAYLAARGYACARFDLRGTGNSDGLIDDEYTPQEQQDGVELIAWLAAQDWCTGAVGMTGISWGGFNALQIAARRPPALAAVITVCSTDDRYADDVHYRGGCLLGTDMLQWAVSMLTWNGLPPDPTTAGPDWRTAWQERVERTPAFIEPWMAHQVRDAYWRQGSVCEDYAAIQAAVYAVGGWADGYSDAVLRLLAGLPGPRKGLIGPWSHSFPNDSVPGPSIGYLEESLRWWDHWLKGVDTGIMEEPVLRAWVEEWVDPAPWHALWPGRWVAETAWPPSRPTRDWWLHADRVPGLGDAPGGGSALCHRGDQTAGLDAGVLCADGGFGDWPGDQRAEDGRSLTFTTAALPSPVEILGHPVAHLELACDRPIAPLVVRLCDLAPDGTSLRVTWGLLELSRRHGMDRSDPMVTGEKEVVALPLKAIGHRFEAGHRIRLAVSTTLWPWVWPAPQPAALTLVCGAASRLELPIREPQAEDEALLPFGPPEKLPSMAVETLERHPTSRRIIQDLATSGAAVVFDWDVGGRTRLPDGLEMDGRNVTTYSIREGDPLSARVVTEQAQALRRGDDYDVSIETR